MLEPAVTAVAVQDGESSSALATNRLSSDGMQNDAPHSIANIETPDHSSVINNKCQEAETTSGEKQDERIATTAKTVVDSKNQLAQKLPIDVDSDGNLSDDELADQLNDSIIYRGFQVIEGVKKLEERKSKASRLAIQSNMYTQLVEDRLRVLEKQLDTLLNLPKTESEDEVDQSMNPLPYHVSVDHMSWTAFSARVEIPKFMLARRIWIHGMEIDSSERKAIEILIEEPQGDTLNWGKRNELIKDIDPALYVPWRLRIRSRLMLKLLERITEQKVTIGVHGHKLVLMRPFKLLVAYADKIFSFLQELEDKLAAKPLISESDGLEHAAAKEFGAIDKGSLKRDQDAEANDETQTPEALVEMRLLKDVLTNDLGPTLELRRGVESGTSQKVTFGDLWHVFRYGQEVRSQGTRQLQLYRVLKFTGGRGVQHSFRDVDFRNLPLGIAPVKLRDDGYSKEAFVLECVYFDFNGTQFGPINKTFIIRKFEGEKNITSLPVYPLNLDPNHVKLRKELLKRGKRFAYLSNPSRTAHMQYQGLTLDQQPEQIESQIIIDFKLAFLAMQECQPVIAPITLVEHDSRETQLDEYSMCDQCTNPGCCGNDINFPDYDVDRYFEALLMRNDKHFLDTVDNIADLHDDQEVLLPCQVYGFALRSRRWATFDIDRVQDVEYADGWENLVIKSSVKETVLALVKNHARQSEHGHAPEKALSSVDLVRGKGKGLIILLHGEPGVGKTSTAECVADHTRRPLFPITCGDIGDSAESVERNLERNFQLAHKWGCVLLLDEADVFLSRRTSSDLTRNAIVSVFLRTLEYYSGILFLTTNRVGNIDRAFKSRIHVALYYPKLDKNSTYEIWKRNIKRIKADFKREKKDFIIEDKLVLKYSKEHFKELRADKFPNWNGRQIRNAFQTAIALAEYDSRPGEKPVLGPKQFAAVAEASKDFDQYLMDTQRGKNDAQLAQEEKSRFDAWGEYTQGSGIIEEGVVYTPSLDRRVRHPNNPPPQSIQRRNSMGLGKQKARQEKELDDDSSDDISSVTDDDKEASEADASEHSAHSDKDAQDSSRNEEERLEEEEVDEPVSPPKAVKTKAKTTSSNRSKVSSSKKADKVKVIGDNDDDEADTDDKPKEKKKGMSSKSR